MNISKRLIETALAGTALIALTSCNQPSKPVASTQKTPAQTTSSPPAPTVASSLVFDSLSATTIYTSDAGTNNCTTFSLLAKSDSKLPVENASIVVSLAGVKDEELSSFGQLSTPLTTGSDGKATGSFCGAMKIAKVKLYAVTGTIKANSAEISIVTKPFYSFTYRNSDFDSTSAKPTELLQLNLLDSGPNDCGNVYFQLLKVKDPVPNVTMTFKSDYGYPAGTKLRPRSVAGSFETDATTGRTFLSYSATSDSDGVFKVPVCSGQLPGSFIVYAYYTDEYAKVSYAKSPSLIISSGIANLTTLALTYNSTNARTLTALFNNETPAPLEMTARISSAFGGSLSVRNPVYLHSESGSLNYDSGGVPDQTGSLKFSMLASYNGSARPTAVKPFQDPAALATCNPEAIAKETYKPIAAGNFVPGQSYRIVSPGSTDFTAIGAPNNLAGTAFIATGPGTGNGVAEIYKIFKAGNFKVGASYKIVYPGSTNFTLLGASSSNVGTTFTATGVGSGDGLAELGASVKAGDFITGSRYKITNVGTTDFVALGASANTTGTIFTATGPGTGTGTADFDDSFTAGSFRAGSAYQIVSTGDTNFLAVGSSSNSPGTIFTASGSGSGTGTAKLLTSTSFQELAKNWRSTLVYMMRGQEPFNDANRNGKYDAGGDGFWDKDQDGAYSQGIDSVTFFGVIPSGAGCRCLGANGVANATPPVQGKQTSACTEDPTKASCFRRGSEWFIDQPTPFIDANENGFFEETVAGVPMDRLLGDVYLDPNGTRDVDTLIWKSVTLPIYTGTSPYAMVRAAIKSGATLSADDNPDPTEIAPVTDYFQDLVNRRLNIYPASYISRLVHAQESMDDINMLSLGQGAWRGYRWVGAHGICGTPVPGGTEISAKSEKISELFGDRAITFNFYMQPGDQILDPSRRLITGTGGSSAKVNFNIPDHASAAAGYPVEYSLEVAPCNRPVPNSINGGIWCAAATHRIDTTLDGNTVSAALFVPEYKVPPDDANGAPQILCKADHVLNYATGSCESVL